MSDIKYPMQLPKLADKTWCLCINTALPSPKDAVPPAEQIPLEKLTYQVDSHSIVVFESISLELAAKKKSGLFDKITGLKFF